LTELLSAWRPGPQPWPLLASIGTLVALGLAVAPMAMGTLPLRTITASYALVATIATAAAVVALAASPDYTSPTPAPFAMAALTASGAALGLVRARRLRP
jgi:hypothetical protein